MSTDLRAFLAIDDNTPSGEPPFTNDPSYWDLSHDIGLGGCKDYEFYAAIAGVRNESGKEPLFPPRGLPKHQLADVIADLWDFGGVGWLTLAEIDATISHFELRRDARPRYVLFVLDVMKLAEQRYGKDRIRLVFGFSNA